jgi:hypothetical protein
LGKKKIKKFNVYKYLPEWYKEELEENHKKTNEFFKSLNKGYEDYDKIID